jgi:hypothetical protein
MGARRNQAVRLSKLAALTGGLVAVAACGRVGYDAAVVQGDGGNVDPLADGGPDGSADAGAPCVWGPFSTPVRVAGGNTTSDDEAPALSSDERELYLSHYSPGVRLLVATRASASDPFSPPTELAALNTGSDGEADISGDGLTLFFQSRRVGTTHLWQSTRADIGDEFTGATSIAATESLTEALGPSVTHDSLEIYFGSDEAGPNGVWAIKRTQASLPFAAAEPVAEVNVGNVWGYPGISPDGLELYVVYTTGNLDISVARRTSRSEPFSAPQPLAEINTTSGESDPELSADGRTLYFSSDRDGDWDIWLATRDCTPLTPAADLFTARPDRGSGLEKLAVGRGSGRGWRGAGGVGRAG